MFGTVPDLVESTQRVLMRLVVEVVVVSCLVLDCDNDAASASTKNVMMKMMAIKKMVVVVTVCMFKL